MARTALSYDNKKTNSNYSLTTYEDVIYKKADMRGRNAWIISRKNLDLISKTIISKQLNIFQLPHDDLIEAVINLKLKSTYMGLFDFLKRSN